jgi:DNA mismatch repair protein MutS2
VNQRTIELLEFPIIRNRVAELAVSNLGRKLAEGLSLKTDLQSIAEMLRETSEARLILDSSGSPPLYGLADLSEVFQKAQIGTILDPLSLQSIADFLRGCAKTREFMGKRLEQATLVAGYSLGLKPLPDLAGEINRCIVDGVVADEATPELKKLRKEILRTREKIKAKMQQFLTAPEAKEWLQEPVVTTKDGHPVLLVKSAAKHQISGSVIGSSGSGSTLFIEPAAVRELNNELRQLEGAEQDEVYQILAWLSGEVGCRLLELNQNLEIMAQYDLAFAKARYSRAVRGVAPGLNSKGRIKLIQARHPLLAETPVPLDFDIGYDYRSLVITGPNTGGKTVTLKTVGLLTLMAQSGLHVPASPGTELAVFEGILADIGDGQNIAQSLSTFSAHMTNIIEILKSCGRRTLVLIDEVGTGTDPVEGAALAMAILEYIHERGAVTVASTHYPEIKTFAMETPGFRNGAMAFDREQLRPLYRLIIGLPGESQALWIAAKLGMLPQVLTKAEMHLQGKGRGEKGTISKEESDLIEMEAEIVPPEIPKLENEPLLAEIYPANENNMPKQEDTPPKVKERPLQVGDLVNIPFLEEKGVICTLPDSKGRLRVLVRGKKMDIPVKRVQLLIPAGELYPEDYDLNIVLLSKEERRLKHQMERKHTPGATRVLQPEER